MSCSVAILTLDEEAMLPRALACLSWCDDIVVIDSGSTDRTVEIARAAGARVVERKLDDWATQGNFMLHDVSYKHAWVYYMDADETLPADLIAEIGRVTAVSPSNDTPSAYRVRYRNWFRGVWLKHATPYPTWITRLMRPDRCRYEPRTVNAHPMVQGRVGELQAHFDHYSFDRGLEHWIAKHNKYSTAEAKESLAARTSGVPFGSLISTDPVRRRRGWKLLFQRMPARPWLKFLYLYLWRRGFLDGAAGRDYCRLNAMYETMIVLKMRDQRDA